MQSCTNRSCVRISRYNKVAMSDGVALGQLDTLHRVWRAAEIAGVHVRETALAQLAADVHAEVVGQHALVAGEARRHGRHHLV